MPIEVEKNLTDYEMLTNIDSLAKKHGTTVAWILYRSCSAGLTSNQHQLNVSHSSSDWGGGGG